MAEQVEEVSPDQAELPYESETAEQLEARFAAGEGDVVEDAEVPPPPVVETPEVEKPAEAAPDNGEVAEVEAKEETPALPEPDDQELEMQELRLELQRAQSAAQRQEFLASRNAGELGHVRKLLESTQRPAEPRPADEFTELAEAPVAQPQPPVDSRLQDEVAELRAAESTRAVQEEYAQFQGRLAGDLAKQGVEADKYAAEIETLMTEVAPLIEQHIEPYKGMELSTKALRKVTKMVLDQAYTDVQLVRVANLRKEALERKTTQVAESKIAKQAASPSASGASPAPKPTQKSPEEMTAEEADAALKAMSGERG